MTNPFNWRDRPRTVDLKEQNAQTKWLLAVSKNPNARNPQRSFTPKGEELAKQRNPK